MTENFRDKTERELAAFAQEKQAELDIAKRHSALFFRVIRIPDKWLDYQIGLQRQRWFAKRIKERDDLSSRRARLPKTLWDKYIAPVQSSDSITFAKANFRREFRRQTALINFEERLQKIGAAFGGFAEAWFALHVKYRLIRLIDVSFAFSLIGVSAVTLFGLSLWTIIDVGERIKRFWIHDHQTYTSTSTSTVTITDILPTTTSIPPSTTTDTTTTGTDTVSTTTTNAPDVYSVFPHDRIPVFWTLGRFQASDLSRGFDRKSVNIDDAAAFEGLCESDHVVVFGAASLEGERSRNAFVARARAAVLLRRTRQLLTQCGPSRRPTVTAVAMYLPSANESDGTQRRAFIVGMKFPGREQNEEPDHMVHIASEGVDLAVGDRLENYERRETCADERCEAWRELR